MTQMNKDILRNPEMKKTPYSVPEGYFDSLKAQARKYAGPHQVPVNIWSRLAPYAGIAAMFLFILLLGKTFITPKNTPQMDSKAAEITVLDDGYEDYLVFSDMEATGLGYIDDEIDIEEINEKDIIEYLIYIGASEKYIGSNNE